MNNHFNFPIVFASETAGETSSVERAACYQQKNSSSAKTNRQLLITAEPEGQRRGLVAERSPGWSP